MRASSLLEPTLIFFLSCSSSLALAQDKPSSPAGDPQQLGSVQFESSCSPEVHDAFGRATALLHSFWYDEAARQFRAVAEQDPTCAMAWWGVAMSHWQPLWEPRGPSPEAFERGRAAISKAAAIGGRTARERGYITALEELYGEADKVDHLDRVLAYERAMKELWQKYPRDPEARVFYALSLLASGTSLPPDKSYERQKRAGELLMPVFRSQPDHPGAAHYLIHAFDYPPLAKQALAAARQYARTAPDSPHAQHMPSHIFTRLGLWDESIDSNRNVIRVARKYGDVGEELHATDYLVFAHLQKGEEDEAREVMNTMPEPEPRSTLYFASIHAHAAVPARYAVERHRWSEAARLPVPEAFPGGRYAWADATLYYARALGAARTGDVEQARSDIAQLTTSRDTLRQHKEDYWATQVEVQRRAAVAWLALAEGERERALELMRSAVALEESTDKHPVTPGAIVSTRDLLGQMLLQLGRYREALVAFEQALEAEPRRYRPIAGAARTAGFAGESDVARRYYAQLLEIAPESDRPEVRVARAYLAASGKTAAR